MTPAELITAWDEHPDLTVAGLAKLANHSHRYVKKVLTRGGVVELRRQRAAVQCHGLSCCPHCKLLSDNGLCRYCLAEGRK